MLILLLLFYVAGGNAADSCSCDQLESCNLQLEEIAVQLDCYRDMTTALLGQVSDIDAKNNAGDTLLLIARNGLSGVAEQILDNNSTAINLQDLLFTDADSYRVKHFTVFVTLNPEYAQLLEDKENCSDLCRSLVFTSFQQWLETAGPRLEALETTTRAAMVELAMVAVTSTTPLTTISPRPPSTSPSPAPTTLPTSTPAPVPATSSPSTPTSSSPPTSEPSLLAILESFWSTYRYRLDADTLLHKCLFYIYMLWGALSWLLHFLRVRAITSKVRSQLRIFLALSAQELHTLSVPDELPLRGRLSFTPNRSAGSSCTAAPSVRPAHSAPGLLQVGDGGLLHPLFPWRSIPSVPEFVSRFLLGGDLNVTEQQLVDSGLYQDQKYLGDITIRFLSRGSDRYNNPTGDDTLVTTFGSGSIRSV